MSLTIEVVDRLKEILRSRGISYKSLALKLEMSEAAIKRAFSEKAFSLKRLEEICESLDITTADLLQPSSHQAKLRRQLSQGQELLLASDEKLMCLFYLLATGKTIAQVKLSYQFTDIELTRFLIALDKAGLIQLNAHNQFRVLVQQDFYWRKNGELDHYYNQQIRRDFVDDEFSGSYAAESFASGYLSKASIEVLKKRTLALEEDVREMMRLDGKYRDDNMKNVTFYLAFRPWTLPLMKKFKRNSK